MPISQYGITCIEKDEDFLISVDIVGEVQIRSISN